MYNIFKISSSFAFSVFHITSAAKFHYDEGKVRSLYEELIVRMNFSPSNGKDHTVTW